jgi:hypothetical protein
MAVKFFRFSTNVDDYATVYDYRIVLGKQFMDYTDMWWKYVIHDIDDCYIFDKIFMVYMEYIIIDVDEVPDNINPLLAEDFTWLLNEDGTPLFAENEGPY